MPVRSAVLSGRFCRCRFCRAVSSTCHLPLASEHLQLTNELCRRLRFCYLCLPPARACCTIACQVGIHVAAWLCLRLCLWHAAVWSNSLTSVCTCCRLLLNRVFVRFILYTLRLRLVRLIILYMCGMRRLVAFCTSFPATRVRSTRLGVSVSSQKGVATGRSSVVSLMSQEVRGKW